MKHLRLPTSRQIVVNVTKAALGTLLATALMLAQTHQHAPPASDFTIDLAKVPAPERITGIGQSHISITTKSGEAQQWFDQGLALLHCFWDYEALRAFADALRLGACRE